MFILMVNLVFPKNQVFVSRTRFCSEMMPIPRFFLQTLEISRLSKLKVYYMGHYGSNMV